MPLLLNLLPFLLTLPYTTAYVPTAINLGTLYVTEDVSGQPEPWQAWENGVDPCSSSAQISDRGESLCGFRFTVPNVSYQWTIQGCSDDPAAEALYIVKNGNERAGDCTRSSGVNGCGSYAGFDGYAQCVMYNPEP